MVDYESRMYDLVYEKDKVKDLFPRGPPDFIFVVLKDGELVMAAEISFTDLENVFNVFTYGFDIKGNPFMAAGKAQGDLTRIDEEFYHDNVSIKVLLRRPVERLIDTKPKIYFAKPETIKRRLQAVKKVMEVMSPA